MANDIDIFSLEPSKISRDLKGKYLLLYGAPKVGKTSFAVQAPRALICAFEMGTNALAGTRFVPMLKWTDFKKVVSQLRKPQAREMYDTIVIDTVSIAFDLCNKYICQREGVDSIRDVAWGQGWGMLKQEFQEAFREITMLGFGLIFIAHAKEKPTEARDSEGNSISAMAPDLTSSAYTIVNSIVDLIGYISVEYDTNGGSERYLYTRQTPTIFAGSRYKYLAPKIKFGYQELVDAIGDAIEQSVSKDGAEVTDHTVINQVKSRPFAEIMEEAKNIWGKYLDVASTEEEKDQHLNVMRDIIRRVFGSEDFKLSTAVPSQADLVELFVDEVKDLM
ncbi:MAG: ATP-binding protein [Methanobrevibacter sp.]|nr:ATP-binding protein [Methanobrevibacter sp.]